VKSNFGTMHCDICSVISFAMNERHD